MLRAWTPGVPGITEVLHARSTDHALLPALLGGTPIAEVAGRVGFHDQAHLHRHFTRLVGTTSGRRAAAGR